MPHKHKETFLLSFEKYFKLVNEDAPVVANIANGRQITIQNPINSTTGLADPNTVGEIYNSTVDASTGVTKFFVQEPNAPYSRHKLHPFLM